MMLRALLLPPLLLASLAIPAWAQETTVIQNENVRYAYAQVLRVSPVYQTLKATRVEQRCDQSPMPDDADSRISRVVGAVKDVLGRERSAADVTLDPENCRAVPVEREFRRPIAYDVDYVYQGAKFRSRLADDPGNRLRIRIGVTPVDGGTRSR